MSPIFSELSDELAGKVTFIKVDTDENEDTVDRFNVQGLPLFHNGEIIGTRAGAMMKPQLKKFIEDTCNEKNIPL